MFQARYCYSCTLWSFFSILENKLIGYADDSTFMAIVPSPGVRVAVAEYLIRGLCRVCEWCDLCGMKLNASNTKTMIVKGASTMHPSPMTVLKESDDLVILGVTFDCKMTFEKHLLSVSRACSFSNTGILRKSWLVFHDRSLLGRCFRGFALPVLEYCSAVLCSAADTHLKLLDHALSGARFLTGGVFECDIAHRRSVAVFVCFIRSGVTRCTLLMVLYLDRMCQCGSHIGTLVHRLAAEHRSTAGLLFPSQCPSGTILLTPYSMVWDWRVSRAGPMYWHKLLYPYYSLLLFFPFSSFSL